MWQSIKSFIGTMIPVLLGVYLAVAAGNCNEDLQLQESLSKIEQVLLTEIEANRALVERSLQYHTDLKDTMVVYRTRYSIEQAKSMSLQEVMGGFGGIRIAHLRHGAYQTGLSSGMLQEMDVDRLMSISNLYIAQEYYQQLGKSYLAQAISLPPDVSAYEGGMFMSFLVNDAIPAERELLYFMDEVEAMLRER